MRYLILYDITQDRTRTHIAKYLEEKGCQRIQKSVFLAQSSVSIFTEIQTYLESLQEEFQKNDTILLIPIGKKSVEQARLIGTNEAFTEKVKDKKILFF
ncbi:CRISPR-associated endonuclease Cas2 [Hugenholtzia roseola]|uniref:CRISPR-associated endonuclease Cas2 n=1 Tax=Hugenholtzia roseola TaxID=1002 RepID=UPI00041DC6A7|nr:CRISPR-associated endonuclease Cas2 [Hugenholtzia roseola]